MKKIEATIMPNKLKSVLNALTTAGFNKLTYFKVKGLNQKYGERKMWRGQEYREIFGDLIQMMLIVKNKDVDNAIDILTNTSSYENSDNIICITEVEEPITHKPYGNKLKHSPIELER